MSDETDRTFDQIEGTWEEQERPWTLADLEAKHATIDELERSYSTLDEMEAGSNAN